MNANPCWVLTTPNKRQPSLGAYNIPMIEISFDNVAFTYDGKSNTLDGVSLHIEQGEFLCVVGGNASGKSTLAKHMNALLIPDNGSVCIRGVPTDTPKGAKHARCHVGMVFQNPDDALVSTLVEDDVAFGPQNLGLPAQEIQERVAQAIVDAGLAGLERHDTVALSGGQKQRVAIAGILAMRPDVIVFDEATAMLDPVGKEEILSVAQRLNKQGMTIVWITHSMEEVARAATRVIALREGLVAFDGAPSKLFADVTLTNELKLCIPYGVRLVNALSAQGIELDVSPATSPEALAEEIVAAQHKDSASREALGLR